MKVHRLTAVLLFWGLAIGTIWVASPFLKHYLFTANEPRPVVAREELTSVERATIELFESAAPSVAYIFTENGNSSSYSPNFSQGGAGSGFVWDKAGHVVTNFHVVKDASKINVRLDSGDNLSAALVGAAPDYDLAVLKLATAPDDLRPIPIGSSADLLVGQSILAIGNPFGLSRSLSTGVISALDRYLPTVSGREISSVIQTDAAINPGNSGGPLLDSSGRLIGINTAIASKSGNSAGVGFAVPVDIVNRVVPKLIKEGKYPRAGIGIEIAAEEVSARLGIFGVIVARVLPNSSAERAGIVGLDFRRNRLGDVITEVNGQPIVSVADLAEALERAGIGSNVDLKIVRGNRHRSVQLMVMDIS